MKDIIEVHKDSITSGDTIIHNGELRTVCSKDITYDSFMGRCIFGDSYKLGYKKVLLKKY